MSHALRMMRYIRSDAQRKAFDYIPRPKAPQPIALHRPHVMANAPALHPSQPISLVLDTNVVLDWLVFHDPSAEPLAQALHAGRARWCVCTRMLNELNEVLQRPFLQPWHPDDTAIRTAIERHASHHEDPASPSPPALQCADGDDQVFIDLALQIHATALLSRDRAVLRLARAARRLGLDILDLRSAAARQLLI
jgi:uncharacterized protein